MCVDVHRLFIECICHSVSHQAGRLVFLLSSLPHSSLRAARQKMIVRRAFLLPATAPSEAPPAEQPRPMTMAERLAAAAARAPEDDLALLPKPKPGGKKGGKKAKKGDDGAAAGGASVPPPIQVCLGHRLGPCAGPDRSKAV